MKGLKGFTNMASSLAEKKSIFGNTTLFNFNDHPNERLQFRLIGVVRGYSLHWIKIKTKTGKEVSIPKMCLNYDVNTDTFSDTGCPYCELPQDKKTSRKYLVNAICRQIQEQEPKEVSRTAKEDKTVTLFEDWECKVKDSTTKSWTPVVCLNLPRTAAQELENIARNNLNKKGEQKDITDPKYGIDVFITYRPDRQGEAKYKVEPSTDGRTPLTEDELDYLVWDIEHLNVETLDEATKEANGLKDKLVGVKVADSTKTITYGDDEDEDKPVKAKSKSFDIDDDEDEAPVKKKSKSFDDDDEDEDKPVKKKSKSYDDDEDEDDSDSDDEDDDFE